MSGLKSQCARGLCLVSALVIAFCGGWMASFYTGGPERAPIQLKASGPIYVPHGFSLAFVPRELTNQDFVPGDRIDVLVQYQGEWRPLVLDVIVAREDWQTIVLIVRHEQVGIFRKARANEMKFRYRKTSAPR